MMPINFKCQKLSPEELKYRLVKQDGKHYYESHNNKNKDIYINKTPFLVRFQEDNNSNWIARRATDEVKEKHDCMQKRLKLLHRHEGQQIAKQESIDNKIKYLEFIREKKNRDQQMLQRLKEEYYQRQVQISISAKNLREQINQEVRMAKAQLQQQKKTESDELMRIREQNNQVIKQMTNELLEKKRQMSDRVRQEKDNSFQAKCRYFNNKQYSQQQYNSEKRQDYQNQQNWLLTEINDLEQQEELARQRYNSLQINRMEKESFMSTFMGINKPNLNGFSSTKNSYDNSPTNHSSSKYQSNNKKFYSHA